MNKEKMRNTILRLYAADPDIVNSRMSLLYAVWRDYGWKDGIKLEVQGEYMPSPASIDRRLRDLRAEKLIVQSDKETKRRENGFKNELEAHSSNNAAHLGLDRA